MTTRHGLVRVLRAWGTPLTIGAFLIMATTGTLMFFHRAVALNSFLHRWAGLVMIGAVVAHAFVNWPSIDRYFTKSGLARGIVGLCAVTLVASFVSWWERPAKVEVSVYRAVLSAPIANVATLLGEPPDAVKTRLAAMGMSVVSFEETLKDAIGDDRDLQARVVSALFMKKGAGP